MRVRWNKPQTNCSIFVSLSYTTFAAYCCFLIVFIFVLMERNCKRVELPFEVSDSISVVFWRTRNNLVQLLNWKDGAMDDWRIPEATESL